MEDVPRETVLHIVATAIKQANMAVTLQKHDYVLCDYSLTYVSSLARVLMKIQMKNKQDGASQEHQALLQNSAQQLLRQIGDEADASAFVIAIEDLILYCMLNNQQMLVSGLHSELAEAISNGIAKTIDYHRAIGQLLCTMMTVADQDLLQPISSLLFDELQNVFKINWDLDDKQTVLTQTVAPLSSILCIRGFADQLTPILVSNIADFVDVVFQIVSCSESFMATSCLFTGLCFQNPLLRDTIQ